MLKQAFTLVELIVVITILAILGTIAFLSLQGYSSNARDSVRVSDVNNINRSMEFMLTKSGRLPVPDSKVEITLSGSVISYQGYAGENVLSVVGINGDAIDPKSGESYTYISNQNYTKFQLLYFLENGDLVRNNSVINNVLAQDEKIIMSSSSNLGGVLYGVDNIPLQVSGSGVDLANTTNEYTLIFDNTSVGRITGTGGELLDLLLYYGNSDYLKEEFIIYDESLIGYWDMKTVTNSGGITYLKDMSGNENHAACYSGNGQFDCDNDSYSPHIKNDNDNYLYFGDGEYGNLKIDGLSNSNFPVNGTIHIGFNDTTLGFHQIFDRWDDSRPHTFIRKLNSGHIQFAMHRGTPSLYMYHHTFFLDEGYNLISFSWDSDNDLVKIYLNGTLLKSDNIDSDRLPIGQIVGFSRNYFTGNLYDYSIYDKVLSDSHVKKIYNSFKVD